MSDKADKAKTESKASKVERPKGPLDAFRDFVGQWERGVNQIANEAMGNEQFSRLMHGATSAAAGAKAGLGEAMERYLATMNLPSRADIVSVGERLQAIEAQLGRLTEIVAQMASVDAAPASGALKPKRTRKPPARSAPESGRNGAKP
ncbi:MAG TPA: poly(R)-hydroxyalkanoic acid synthase subunit PhaE [Rhodoblastus sp.]|nr:poly(R)-hydroxyalkanoic acid synthase subunit PhaE [Rhodoblastus sp.]